MTSDSRGPVAGRRRGTPLETYLRELITIRHSGAAVPETSFYPALKMLLDEVGGMLNPKVRCIVNLRNRGAGIPDGGLFTADQLRHTPHDPLAGQLPARAAIEVKGTADDIDAVARSEQVARYLDRYGLVLVTNLRDFVLVGRGRSGKPVRLEAYRLSDSEQAFWAEAVHARWLVERQGEGLVEPYKYGLISEWGIKKFNLDDLYVRFFRLAERQIAEHTRRGVVCYISNFSYLGDPSFVVMRRRWLDEFDALWFDCMNGDSRETGKVTPEGRPDPSVFSTESNPAGIRVGTAIGLMVRRSARAQDPVVRFRQFWGAKKRAELVASLSAADMDAQYEVSAPTAANRYSFRLGGVGTAYLEWPALIGLAEEKPFPGIAEDRRRALISIDIEPLRQRMKMYFDSSVGWEDLSALGTGLTADAPRFVALRARERLQSVESYDESRIVRYLMRPFDLQWCYYSPLRPLWREPRPEYWFSYDIGTTVLVSRFKAAKSPEGPPLAFARQLCDYHMLPPNASVIPFRISRRSKLRKDAQVSLPTMAVERTNLSSTARAYLAFVGIPDPDADSDTAAFIWMHALAIGYSPAYLTENADGIRQDWPRIPLPAARDLLLASAVLGRQIAALLDTESPVEGITTSSIRPELRSVGVVSQADPGPLNLVVTVGWGHAGQRGVTMPGKGRSVEREPTPEERVGGLGDMTVDVYLNDDTYWRNVPKRVWDYTIGGYQVIKKWLSYREEKLLGRPLKDEEAREVRDMARRIAAIVLLASVITLDTVAYQRGRPPLSGHDRTVQRYD